jgi:hypothetical protein
MGAASFPKAFPDTDGNLSDEEVSLSVSACFISGQNKWHNLHPTRKDLRQQVLCSLPPLRHPCFLPIKITPNLIGAEIIDQEQSIPGRPACFFAHPDPEFFFILVVTKIGGIGDKKT